MHVVLGVGMQMVVAVLRGPPQNALLCGALAQDGEHELEGAAGRIRAMGEQAMIARADGENPQPIEGDAKYERFPGHARPNRPETGKMYQKKGNRRRIDNIVMYVGSPSSVIMSPTSVTR